MSDPPAAGTSPSGALSDVAPDSGGAASLPASRPAAAPDAANNRHAVSQRLSKAALQTLLQERTAELQAAAQQVARLQDTLGQRQRQIEAMHRVSEAMFQHLDASVTARQTLDIALEALDAEAGSLQIYDEEHDTLVFQYVVGPTAETLTGYVMPAAQGISGQVLRTGVPDVTRHVREHGGVNPMLDRQSKDGHHAETMATVPLKRPAGDPVGVVQVVKATDKGFNRADLEVLQVLCAQAAAAIETARLAKEARKAEVGRIIGDVSHDIKNMLTPIQSGLWTLEPSLNEFFAALDEVRQRCYGRAVQSDIERAAALVRDDYGWIFSNAHEACEQVKARTREIADAVKGEIAPPFFEVADLNETVREVARPLFMLADKTNVHLHLELDHALPQAEFDRKQMYNALYNLVNNALPETPSGGSVTIRTRGPEPGESTLLLEVEDTGRGMPEHVRARLFTDEAISTKPGGTGLGTRIVAGVVRRHHGSITVRSEEGRGSTFSIRLPLRHTEEQSPPLEASRRLPVRHHNLLKPATALLGREQEQSVARDVLLHTETRLLTISGPGGMGKTRLALQVARDLLDDFADGVWFVSLAPVDDPALVASTLAATLGVREELGRPLAATLADYLRPRRVLLVLDNFEQVLEAAPLVAGLLDECPDLRVIVTSRAALHLPGEREMTLPPLELPDLKQVLKARTPTGPEMEEWAQCAGVALFVERAAQVQPDFALTPENVRDVAEICARLDGLPLAIELAAAHIQGLAPHAMRTRLTDRLQLLEADVPERESPGQGLWELPERHQTLRATIDWSYELLGEPEQRLLRRLMVFEGGCRMEAAQAVCDAGGDLGIEITEGLSLLVDKSLLRRAQAPRGQSWFFPLETIREYGLEKLAQSGEHEALRRRHAAYYLRVAESAQAQRQKSEQAGPPLPGVPGADAPPAAWSDWRRREDSNLRAALAWFLDNASETPPNETPEDERTAHGALLFALTLRDIWTGDKWNERREALRRALEQSAAAPITMRLMGMLRAGDLACLQADYRQAEEFGQQSLQLSRQNALPWGISRALGILAKAAMGREDYATARALHEERLALSRARHDAGAVAWTLYDLGTVAERSHDAVASRDYFTRSLAAFRETDDKEGIAWSLYNLGVGVYDRAHPAPARRLLEECLVIFREIENKSGIARTLCFLGKIARHAQDFALARDRLHESLELARQLGDRGHSSSALWNLGDVALAEGDHEAARAFYQEVMTILQTLSNTARLRDLLKSFACLAAAQGQMERVARLLGAFAAGSESQNEAAAPPLTEDLWQRREALLARGVLGEVAFAAAWDQGHAMTLPQALDEALQV